jgi:predicted transcriptional regulator
MDLLTDEWPDARQQAVTTVADAYQSLDQAVRNGEDVFVANRGWVDASIRAWEIDEGLGRMRRFHGVNMRETPAPTFAFGVDVAVILDQVSLELQDEAVQRIDQRRAEYLAGRTSK